MEELTGCIVHHIMQWQEEIYETMTQTLCIMMGRTYNLHCRHIMQWHARISMLKDDTNTMIGITYTLCSPYQAELIGGQIILAQYNGEQNLHPTLFMTLCNARQEQICEKMTQILMIHYNGGQNLHPTLFKTVMQWQEKYLKNDINTITVMMGRTYILHNSPDYAVAGK